MQDQNSEVSLGKGKSLLKTKFCENYSALDKTDLTVNSGFGKIRVLLNLRFSTLFLRVSARKNAPGVKEGKRRMKFRPCIDLHQGKVKQIVGSTLTEDGDRKPVENFVSELRASDFARYAWFTLELTCGNCCIQEIPRG